MHQIDHFTVSESSFKCVFDCRITEPMLYSDHRAIKCNLRVLCRLKWKTDPRQKSYILIIQYWAAIMCLLLSVNYSNLASAVAKAATSVLPKSERTKPGRFKANETEVIPLIQVRNSAMAKIYSSEPDRKPWNSVQLANSWNVLFLLPRISGYWINVIFWTIILVPRVHGTLFINSNLACRKQGQQLLNRLKAALRVRHLSRRQKSSERTFRNYMDGYRTMIKPL